MEYKIDFNGLQQESPMNGIEHKILDSGNKRFRLVEYSKNMHPHWCSRGHYGIILEGILDIEFNDRKIRYNKGDGIHLPEGNQYRHKAIVISDKVKVFFVEDL